MDIFKLFGTIAIKGVEETKQDLKDTSEEAVELAGSLENAIDKAIDLSVKVAAATSAAVTAIGGLALASSNSLEESFDSFVAATDTSAESLAEYEDVLKSIYKKNYGESFEDIATAMTTIKQQAGDISAEELEELTINALMLKDTFDMEVNESMRASKMLMNQFGISGKEAYNLIAQGAKNGLDKNGDLLDSINEYSVHYKQLGFDAEDFFNSLLNGTEAGTFSVDKLGDAMKEYGIRVKDGSDTSRQAFETLGYDADQMFQIFNEGGENAAIATQEIINKLAAMPDGVEKTTAGVALFGTMWEDLGATGINALGNLDGGISTTKKALESIDNIKYNNLNSKLGGVKRKLETSIITPLGKKLQPKAEEFLEMVESKIPSIQELCEELGDKVIDILDNAEPAFSWFIDDALPVLIDILGFVIDNFDKLAIGVGVTVAAFKTMQIISTVSTAIQGASTAMGVFNAVLSANPIGLVTTAIGGLVVAIGGLSMAQEDEKTILDETREKIELERQAREEKLQAIEDERKAIEEKAEFELIEVANTEALYKELQTLVDENGNVTEANKTRAEYILNELNEAMGTEYTMVGNQIQGYEELQAQIENTIATKRAEILMTAQEEKYTKAVNAVQEAQNQLTQDSIALAEQKEKANQAELDYLEDGVAAKERIAEIDEEILELAGEYGNDVKIQNLKAEQYELGELAKEKELACQAEKELLAEKQAAYDSSKNIIEMYYSDMAIYENAQAELLAGNTETAIQMLDHMGRSYQTASDLASASAEERKRILEEQVIQAEITVDQIEAMLANASEEEKAIYERQLQSAKEYANKAKEEYYIAGGDIVKSYASGADSATYILGDTISSAIDEVTNASNEKVSKFKSIGMNAALGIAKGIEDAKTTVLVSMAGLADSLISQAVTDLDIHSPSRRMADEIGAYIPSGVAKGIDENKDDALDSVDEVVGQMTTRGKRSVSENTVVTQGSRFDITSILNKLDQLITVIKQLKIYMNGDVIVGELIPAIDSELGHLYAMAERGQ